MRSMASERRRIACLRDVMKCCDQIGAFLCAGSRKAFDGDLRTQNAILYSLQTVGEAAIGLDKEEKRRSEPGLMEGCYPHIPWRDVLVTIERRATRLRRYRSRHHLDHGV
ncbi:DUF86 domain-containing protein [Bradyrhizobium sp. CCBAU 53421]|uniref:HepT-like ribonuclease domain-containing protein n=1 Tax=Bradyrhizobium sp. CCBAU 53421 TaxID=1325120 RepID=UPI0018BFA797|nr:hypothetical protein XH92_36930 [Bradyrhizobium sp. CCBAU 53421]